MADLMQTKARVEGHNISMYPQDWAAVQAVAEDMGLTVSGAIRFVLRDWLRQRENHISPKDVVPNRNNDEEPHN